ncbi:UPF0172-domain-containing protein, partial [Fomitiporia mediterranea MF3/22]|uniref:UPF0172-domain-containing protein n=1 Tax=Fomitiporia mediterranea (strain MF3/22) TaxID=694068 RepID=UPI00044091F5
SFVVHKQAYAKIAFHAAKYPHRQVNGLLVGKEKSGSIEFTDAIPLLHHWTNLSPSMEIGLDLASNYAQSNGLEVAGFYQVSEHITDTTLTAVGEKVADTIRKGFPNAVAFVVDGSKLAAGEPALIVSWKYSTSWRPANDGVQPFTDSSRFKLSTPNITSSILRLIREDRIHQKLGDFDEHLEDVSIDWLRNSEC